MSDPKRPRLNHIDEVINKIKNIRIEIPAIYSDTHKEEAAPVQKDEDAQLANGGSNAGPAKAQPKHKDNQDGVEVDMTDFVILSSGNTMHVAHYYGEEYKNRISSPHY